MKLAYGWVVLLPLLFNGCATVCLHEAAQEHIWYDRGACNPQAYVTAEGELRVFEMGHYYHGIQSYNPLNSWHHIDLPLNGILRSLTNGQASVIVRINPQFDDKPDEADLLMSGYHPIPVLFVTPPPGSVLSFGARVPYLKREGTNDYAEHFDKIGESDRNASLIAYLELHAPQTTSRQALVYLNQYRENSVWYDRDGLVSGYHSVVLRWSYTSSIRWYLYVFAPVTVAVDIVTLPIQGVGLLYMAYQLKHNPKLW